MQDLYGCLKEEIDDISVIDAHSYLSPSSAAASNLRHILFYHYILPNFSPMGCLFIFWIKMSRRLCLPLSLIVP